jgi:hypothetical protein
VQRTKRSIDATTVEVAWGAARVGPTAAVATSRNAVTIRREAVRITRLGVMEKTVQP